MLRMPANSRMWHRLTNVRPARGKDSPEGERSTVILPCDQRFAVPVLTKNKCSAVTSSSFLHQRPTIRR